MPKTASVHARVDDKIKARAEKILRRVGVTTSDAVNLLLHQIILRDGLPFEVRIPNAETAGALRELDSGEGETFTGSTREIFDRLAGARKQRKQ